MVKEQCMCIKVSLRNSGDLLAPHEMRKVLLTPTTKRYKSHVPLIIAQTKGTCMQKRVSAARDNHSQGDGEADVIAAS